MLRLRTLAIIMVLLGVACSGGQQEVISSFLTAVQTGNEDAADATSLVEFPGDVESWEIVEVGPVSSEPFAIAGLELKLSELSRERRTKKDNNAYFVQDNRRAYDDYTAKREKDPEYEFSGEAAEFQKEWEEKLGRGGRARPSCVGRVQGNKPFEIRRRSLVECQHQRELRWRHLSDRCDSQSQRRVDGEDLYVHASKV